MIRPLAKPTPRFVEKLIAKREREREAIENRAKVRKRDGGRCVACKKVGYTDAHHIKFRSQGGSDDVSNQVSVCRDCHKAIHGHALRVYGHDAASVRFEWDPRLKKRTA